MNKKNFYGEKKGRNLQESNRGGSLSMMDRTIDVMCTEGQIRVKTHSMNMTEWMNSWS